MKNKIYILLFSILFFGINTFSQSDNCATATVLTLNAAGNICISGTTVNATSSNTGYSNCNPLPNVNNEVWYTYVSNGKSKSWFRLAGVLPRLCPPCFQKYMSRV